MGRSVVIDIVYVACGRKPCVEGTLSKFISRGASFVCRIVIRSSTSASGATRVVQRCRGGCPRVVGPVCRARGRCSGKMGTSRIFVRPLMHNGCVTLYRKSSC